MKRKLKIYEVHYRNDNNNQYETHQFKASCLHEAKLLALEFCDSNWYKYYGVIEVLK